jgi:apolipoprotein N-acyltransferase
MIQPNIPQAVKYEVVSQEEQQKYLRDLTLSVGQCDTDLIIWPETALVEGPSFTPSKRVWLRDLVQRTRTPILLGTLDATEPKELPKDGSRPVPIYYNAAMLIRTDGVLSAPYRKLHLVPFGEYVPLESWCPWLRRLTPIEGSFTPGSEPVWFEVKGCRLGPLICFEDTIPSLARQLTAGGADLLVNLTNDAWFEDSPGAAMHAANATFRAIENRRPLVRCTNSGITCVIDSNGRLLADAYPAFSRGFQVSAIPIREKPSVTFYTRRGDWFPLLGVMIVAIALAKRPRLK